MFLRKIVSWLCVAKCLDEWLVLNEIETTSNAPCISNVTIDTPTQIW
jgi:hypothetical protein